ncbi:MAG: hypothetical protein DI551_10440 [Micavibrio aeruginosavorus]|uniref:Uncharacterized protein n=1 Tax=Micavibrio aeruginosavorus TaxID=349221 RepID=A0A2W5MU11_9BACT|nr:MAG: hypothetical protein DI551_10440 [Micavibrio aeruginosavorus]
MTQKHTPTPYTLTKDKTADGDIMLVISSGTRVIWQAYDSPENEATAAFIVLACNSHQALVEALEEAQQITKFMYEQLLPHTEGNRAELNCKYFDFLTKKNAALALAKGE